MIKAGLKRNGKDITFAKALSDEIYDRAKNMAEDLIKSIFLETHAPVSPGVTSDRARKHQSSGGGGSVSSFDEVNKSKRKRGR